VDSNDASHVDEFQKKLVDSLLPSPSVVARDQLFAVLEVCHFSPFFFFFFFFFFLSFFWCSIQTNK
jgi:hypothetical protein